MGRGIRGLAALSIIGGASYGGFKAMQEFKRLKMTHNNVVLFHGEKLIYDESFEGDSIGAIGAGVEVDLREADFIEPFTSMDLYGLGAGFKVLVPENIKVVVAGINRASGVQVSVNDEVKRPVLTINYDLTGSGLMVTTKHL